MHTLRYTSPARFWEEALPIGNGRIGAMIYGGVGKEKIELNEDTIWSGRPSDEDGYKIRENIEDVRQLIRDGKYAEATERTDDMTDRHWVQSYHLAGNLYLDFGSDEYDSYERVLRLQDGIGNNQFYQALVGRHIEHRRIKVCLFADLPLALCLKIVIGICKGFCGNKGLKFTLQLTGIVRGNDRLVWSEV